ncbi:MAG TPA: BTAD domain-containing putative transcriptional regulator [Ktedonobacteraceae bacterium]|nr:BTAD domain-containing putative transcriptional regulator [Ktedonobacteraceae bacterium]
MNITTKQSHPPYPCIRIFTFGEFAIERLISSPTAPTFPPCYARLPWEEWSNRRAAMELLKILLCAPNRRASKDELIQSIWPDHAMINALHALDSAASILRRHILQPHSEESLLQTIRGNGDTALKLAAQSYLWVDADAFLTFAARAARAENQGHDPLPLLERAHTLVQGQFLEDDPHAVWSQGRRNTINGAQHRVFYKLVELYLRDDRRVCEAEELLFWFLEENPTDEDALCYLMIILAERGRRQEALNMYAYVANELRGEKGEPAPYTQELVRRIRHGLAVRERSISYTTTSVKATALRMLPALRLLPAASNTSYANRYGTRLLRIAVGVVCLNN